MSRIEKRCYCVVNEKDYVYSTKEMIPEVDIHNF